MSDFSPISSTSFVPISSRQAHLGKPDSVKTDAIKTTDAAVATPSSESAASVDEVAVVTGAPEVAETVDKTEAEEKALADAISTMSDFVQSVKRDLHFHVDEDLKKTVIKVVDGASGDVIRQIPEESFLELARKMKEQGEVHFISAKG